MKNNLFFGERASTILYWFLHDIADKTKDFLLPANICQGVYFVFLKVGINVKFVDIENVGWNIDLGKCKSEIERNNIGGILFNHTYGNEATPFTLLNGLKQINPELIIIDDRCLCAPETEFKNFDHNIFDLVLYSTGYAKQINLGYGGYGWSNNNIYFHAVSEKHNPDLYKDVCKIFDTNPKLDDLKTACKSNWLTLSKLVYNPFEYFNNIEINRPEFLAHKLKIKDAYYEIIPENLIFEEQFNNWRFNILCKNKDEILKRIFENDLFASNHYIPLTKEKEESKNSEFLHSHIINLFISPNFDESQAIKAANIIKKYAVPIN